MVQFKAVKIIRNLRNAHATKYSYISVTVTYRINKHVGDIRSSAVLNFAVVKTHVVGPHHVTYQQVAIV